MEKERKLKELSVMLDYENEKKEQYSKHRDNIQLENKKLQSKIESINAIIKNENKNNIIDEKVLVDKLVSYMESSNIKSITEDIKEEFIQIDSKYNNIQSKFNIENQDSEKSLIITVNYENKNFGFRILTEKYTFAELLEQCSVIFGLKSENCEFFSMMSKKSKNDYNSKTSSYDKIDLCESVFQYYKNNILFENGNIIKLESNSENDNYLDEYNNDKPDHIIKSQFFDHQSKYTNKFSSYHKLFLLNLSDIEDKLLYSIPKMILYLIFIFASLVLVAQKFNISVYFQTNYAIKTQFLNSKFYMNNDIGSSNTFYYMERMQDTKNLLIYFLRMFSFRNDANKENTNNSDGDTGRLRYLDEDYSLDSGNSTSSSNVYYISDYNKNYNFTRFLKYFLVYGEIEILSTNIMNIYNTSTNLNNLKELTDLLFKRGIITSEFNNYFNSLSTETFNNSISLGNQTSSLKIKANEIDTNLLFAFFRSINFFNNSTSTFTINLNLMNIAENIFVNVQFKIEQNKFSILTPSYSICTISNLTILKQFFHLEIDAGFAFIVAITLVRILYAVYNIKKTITHTINAFKSKKQGICNKLKIVFYSPWQIFLFIKCILVMIILVLEVFCYILVTKIGSKGVITDLNFVDSNNICSINEIINLLEAVFIFFLLLYFINFVESELMRFVINTIFNLKHKIFIFLMKMSILIIAFSFCISYIYGPYFSEFQDFFSSLSMVLFVLMGDKNVLSTLSSQYYFISTLLIMIFIIIVSDIIYFIT